MFLCPAAKPAKGLDKATLSDVLRTGTRDVHAASDSLIRQRAPLAFSQPKLWAALLSQFYYVFRALELGLEKAAAKDARVRSLHRPFFAQLGRADAFLADVAYHSKGGAPAAPLAAAKDYAARIGELADSAEPADRLLLLAYALTLYQALLSGGQLLERMLRGTMLLPAGRGTAIFRFELPRSQHAHFKKALCAAVDELGTKLTEEEMGALLQEKRSIFWRYDRLIQAVFKDARGSLLIAWLRLARAAVLSLLLSWRAMLLLATVLLAVLAVRSRVLSSSARVS